jgi:hypothetical protein
MKKIIVAGAVSAIAAISFAGTTSAAPAPDGPACFGQIHKAVNAGALADPETGKPANVGQFVMGLDAKGQDKKMIVNSEAFCG